MHVLVSAIACSAHEHDHYYETVWIETHHWKHSTSRAWGPTSMPSPQQEEACLEYSELTTSSRIGRPYPCADKKPRWKDCPWPFGSAVCLLGLWLNSSNLHAPADVTELCLGSIPKYFWRILCMAKWIDFELFCYCLCISIYSYLNISLYINTLF